jgi:hypothetical protein
MYVLVRIVLGSLFPFVFRPAKEGREVARSTTMTAIDDLGKDAEGRLGYPLSILAGLGG